MLKTESKNESLTAAIAAPEIEAEISDLICGCPHCTKSESESLELDSLCEVTSARLEAEHAVIWDLANEAEDEGRGIDAGRFQRAADQVLAAIQGLKALAAAQRARL